MMLSLSVCLCVCLIKSRSSVKAIVCFGRVFNNKACTEFPKKNQILTEQEIIFSFSRYLNLNFQKCKGHT